MKLFFLDVETTGLDYKSHDIIEIAGLIYFDNIKKHEFSYNCQPIKRETKTIKFIADNGKKFEFNGQEQVEVVLNNGVSIHVKAIELSKLEKFKIRINPDRIIYEIVGPKTKVISSDEWNPVSQKALEVNKLSMQEIKKFSRPRTVVENIRHDLKKFYTSEPYILVGHNIKFDYDFFIYWAQSLNYFDIEGMIHKTVYIDTLDMARYLKAKGMIKADSLKLGSLCKEFGIDLKDAHRALYDIRANAELFFCLDNMIQKQNEILKDQCRYSQISLF